MTNTSEDLSISLPITQSYRQIAAQFSQQQPTGEKATQVLLNSLAVLVVNDCLQMLGIPTDLSASDSWNSVVRMGADLADIVIPGKGRLECRPIKTGAETCPIPLEVWSDRIGYLVVQIDGDLRAGKLLGFVPNVDTVNLPITQLQPLEKLLEKLHQPATNTLVNLSQWLADIFETGWQQVETLLTPTQNQLAFSFRNNKQNPIAIQRAKLIDLGMIVSGHPVALIVEITPVNNESINIRLMLHTTGNEIAFLPPAIQLILLDELGNNLLTSQARKADNYIQLQFSGEPGERFSVKVALGDASITENFII